MSKGKSLFFIVALIIIAGFVYNISQGPYRTYDGPDKVSVPYVEKITSDKQDLIFLENIKPGDIVQNTIFIKGMARGYWYFEASFPIEIKDDNGNIVGSGIAQAKSEWMSENFVPFEANITLSGKPTTKYGKIILKKDNPSGDPERDDSLIVPVIFATSN